MLNRRDVALAVVSAISGSVALTVAILNPPVASAETGHILLVAAYGLILGAVLCFCGLLLGSGLGLSPFSTQSRASEARGARRVLPIAGSVVLLIVLWFAGGAVLKRILRSAPPDTFEAATSVGQEFLAGVAKSERERLGKIAAVVAQMGEMSQDPGADAALPLRALALSADAAWTLNSEGRVRWGLGLRGFIPKGNSYSVETEPLAPDPVETLSNALEVWEVDDKYFLAVGASLPKGRLMVARRVPPEWIEQWKHIETAAGVAARRDELLAGRAARLNVLLYGIVLLLLGGAVVSAKPWSQGAKHSTEAEAPKDESSES